MTKHQLHANLADSMRNISLRELLRWHRFEIKPESITCRARDSRCNIVVPEIAGSIRGPESEE